MTDFCGTCSLRRNRRRGMSENARSALNAILLHTGESHPGFMMVLTVSRPQVRASPRLVVSRRFLAHSTLSSGTFSAACVKREARTRQPSHVNKKKYQSDTSSFNQHKTCCLGNSSSSYLPRSTHTRAPKHNPLYGSKNSL